jgi:hypothetical protein
MAAQVVLFSDYPSFTPKPARLYCDSNFLIRLMYYHDNATNPSILTSRDIGCYQFYTALSQNGCELVTSVYGFSELIYYYFFWYGKYGMYQVVRDFFRNNNVVLSGSIHDKYKYFIKTYPADFTAAFQKIAHRIDKADAFLTQAGIKILYPLPSPRLTNISKLITEYAAILLDAFPKIESNDAMHLAIADYLNIQAVISLDDGFKDVDGYTIFSYS